MISPDLSAALTWLPCLPRNLAIHVTAGEPYTCVFPNGNIPQSAWSAPGRNLLKYIPSPNVGVESVFYFSVFADRSG